MSLVGNNIHWKEKIHKSKDPTLLFLAILWYALYAWDESFESLQDHIDWLVRRPRAGWCGVAEVHSGVGGTDRISCRAYQRPS